MQEDVNKSVGPLRLALVYTFFLAVWMLLFWPFEGGLSLSLLLANGAGAGVMVVSGSLALFSGLVWVAGNVSRGNTKLAEISSQSFLVCFGLFVVLVGCRVMSSGFCIAVVGWTCVFGDGAENSVPALAMVGALLISAGASILLSGVWPWYKESPAVENV